MSFSTPSLPSASSKIACRPAASAQIAGPVLIASAAAVLLGSGIVASTLLSSSVQPPAHDPCGVPAGVALDTLDPHARTLTARRLLVCNDLRFGRITPAQYAASVASIDARWAVPAPVPPPSIVWASKVLGFSTEYSSSSWSASQVLGAPNVFPGTGDHVHAWASRGADDRAEWLEVGFEVPRSVSGVEIYETFNAGAVDRVELVTASGRRITAYAGSAQARAGSFKRQLQIACTSEPIAAVRVSLASQVVAGWNEIDAIGVVPCTRS